MNRNVIYGGSRGRMVNEKTKERCKTNDVDDKMVTLVEHL